MVFDLFQEFLLDENRNYLAFIEKVENKQNNLSERDLILSNLVIRTTKALRDFDRGFVTEMDALALLRQVTRFYNRRLIIQNELWKNFKGVCSRFNIVGALYNSNQSRIRAHNWDPGWLSHTRDMDHLRKRRSDNPVIGDGMLFRMTKGEWKTYKTIAQKSAVDAWAFSNPGTTTLVSIPTGGGKSLCITLVAWLNSNGGKRPGKATLVIVPTVSLAIDQVKEAKKFFSEAISEDFKPKLLTGNTTKEERVKIYEGIKTGRLPILYTSPEALLHSGLYNICIQSAKHGTLDRLVIDEAHIVETWGTGFRTDFQLLSGYRKKLLSVSNQKLKTLLLSATISDSCRDTLHKLFCEDDKFIEIYANRLRPEISYWIAKADNEKTRTKHILEAVHYLPRPIILYVTRKSDAEKWLKNLTRKGFTRIAKFTGDTPTDERNKIISKWRNDEIDLMIATSAFGLGVNKSNIRTIIHTTIPETVDRYYQEVGRGGRDGYSSISLLCFIEEDKELVKYLTPKFITAEVAYERWKGLRESSFNDEGLWIVDRDAIPPRRPDIKDRNERNREWNEHLLLLMQRANLIDIVASGISNKEEDYSLLPLQIKRPSVINSEKKFKDSIRAHRDIEKRNAIEGMKHIFKVVENYAHNTLSNCMSNEFSKAYPLAQVSCGGCPYCRNKKYEPFSNPIVTNAFISDQREFHQGDLSHDTVENLLGSYNSVIVMFGKVNELINYHKLLSNLTHRGFPQLILSEKLIRNHGWFDIFPISLSEAPKHTRFKMHRILFSDWLIKKQCYPLKNFPTIVIYPRDEYKADEIFGIVNEQLAVDVPIIHIIYRKLYLRSRTGYFKDRVDGLNIDISKFEKSVLEREPPDLF